MCAVETILYKGAFDRAVVVRGAVYGGRSPFKAVYITTCEGPAFRRVPPKGFWDTLDI